MARKPVYSLPLLAGPRATKATHDAEINRCLGELWDTAVVARLGTPEAEALVTEFQQLRDDTQAAADEVLAELDAWPDDPGAWRALIGVAGDRDAITVDGTHVLDATKFLPNATVFGGNGTRNYILDVSSAVVGYTYAIFNAGILGDRLTLDCGAEYGFLGFGVTPNNLTTKQITVDPGQVAYITRANLTRVHVYVEGVYWVKPDINNSWRRMDDGTYDVLYRRAGNIAATTEASDIVLPAGFSLDGASVLSVTLQPRTDGVSYNGSPPFITKMGTANGLAANRAAIYNPNSTLMTHPVLIHFSNVTRS